VSYHLCRRVPPLPAGDTSLPTDCFCERAGPVAARDTRMRRSGPHVPSPITYRRKVKTVGPASPGQCHWRRSRGGLPIWFSMPGTGGIVRRVLRACERRRGCRRACSASVNSRAAATTRWTALMIRRCFRSSMASILTSGVCPVVRRKCAEVESGQSLRESAGTRRTATVQVEAAGKCVGRITGRAWGAVSGLTRCGSCTWGRYRRRWPHRGTRGRRRDFRTSRTSVFRRLSGP